MGLYQRLIQRFRDAGVGDALNRGVSPFGSAVAPPPAVLQVPDELRQAVDEEHARRADGSTEER